MRADIEQLLQQERQKQSASIVSQLSEMTLDRRQFLKVSALSTGGLCIGFSMPTLASSGGQDKNATFNPNAFIHLYENGDVLIYCGRCEMGQGISTALPSVIADEMDADWRFVRVEQAEGDQDKYGSQATGGSASIRTMYEPMRSAGAAA